MKSFWLISVRKHLFVLFDMTWKEVIAPYYTGQERPRQDWNVSIAPNDKTKQDSSQSIIVPKDQD